MNNVVSLFPSSPAREQEIAEFAAMLHECMREVTEELGIDALKAFFDGYKSSPDVQKLAA